MGRTTEFFEKVKQWYKVGLDVDHIAHAGGYWFGSARKLVKGEQGGAGYARPNSTSSVGEECGKQVCHKARRTSFCQALGPTFDSHGSWAIRLISQSDVIDTRLIGTDA